MANQHFHRVASVGRKSSAAICGVTSAVGDRGTSAVLVLRISGQHERDGGGVDIAGRTVPAQPIVLDLRTFTVVAQDDFASGGRMQELIEDIGALMDEVGIRQVRIRDFDFDVRGGEQLAA